MEQVIKFAFTTAHLHTLMTPFVFLHVTTIARNEDTPILAYLHEEPLSSLPCNTRETSDDRYSQHARLGRSEGNPFDNNDTWADSAFAAQSDM